MLYHNNSSRELFNTKLIITRVLASIVVPRKQLLGTEFTTVSSIYVDIKCRIIVSEKLLKGSFPQALNNYSSSHWTNLWHGPRAHLGYNSLWHSWLSWWVTVFHLNATSSAFLLKTSIPSWSNTQIWFARSHIQRKRESPHTPISVTKQHEEHLTDGAPYGYISNTAQLAHLTCPTWWAEIKDTVKKI